MALPVIATIGDCADFSKTVAPYIPQLYDLPNQVFSSVTNVEALQQLYVSTNPVISGFAFTVATFPIFFLVSEINKNYSQVDRIWSILPTIFHAHYAIWARLNGLPTQKVDNVLAFSVVWTLRLTYNYWRKGGYSIGSEDYRWMIIKEYIGGFGFVLLNLTFISTLQLLILFAVTTPTYILLLASRLSPTMSFSDNIFARILIALVVVEWFADQQQWDYQQAKAAYRATAKVPSRGGFTRAQLDRGFVTTGLWKYSRHPNFAAEQTIWVVLYQWACFHTFSVWNWTFIGMMGYLLVFQGSTPLTEWISAGKYPEYRVYQERVGKFLPSVIGKGWDEVEMERLGPAIVKGEDEKRKKMASKKEK